MPTQAELAKISALAAEEIRRPFGAYDIITRDGKHPLAHCLTGDRAMRPSNPILRRMARDQELDPRGAQEYGNGGEAEAPSASDLLQMIQICLAKLGPDEREAFVAGLGDIMDQDATDDGTLQITHNSNGAGYNNNANPGALDRNRSGNRTTRDVETTHAISQSGRYSQDPRKNPAQDRRRTAQDAAFAVRGLNHQNFLNRFPDAAKVHVWGRR